MTYVFITHVSKSNLALNCKTWNAWKWVLAWNRCNWIELLHETTKASEIIIHKKMEMDTPCLTYEQQHWHGTWRKTYKLDYQKSTWHRTVETERNKQWMNSWARVYTEAKERDKWRQCIRTVRIREVRWDVTVKINNK